MSKTLKKLWNCLYGDEFNYELTNILNKIKNFKSTNNYHHKNKLWYKDVVIYSTYIHFFNKNIAGIIQKLDYLENLGINCLWLLPILESPMKDGGFDISDYKKVRKNLLSDEKNDKEFEILINEAHKRNIKIIFDIALNHTSDEHFWFKQAKQRPENKYKNYYIWNDNDKKYSKARLLFKGMVNNNWEKYKNEYYFHRFYEFQPDLNYKNPQVLLEMIDIFLFWLSKNLDGFRADAIPFLWKEEETDCENLPKTHLIIKFFREIFEQTRPGTLLLAEACQRPKQVVEYFGNDDECQAAYHFPLMPQIFKAIAIKKRYPIIDILKPKNTPSIPDNSQWFLFLRNHDELTLEMVSKKDKKLLNNYYLHNKKWAFRIDEGISARLSELFEKDINKILLSYSIILTLPGTPIIFYGDEFAKLNDEKYFNKMKKKTGYEDSRFYVRGNINWNFLENELQKNNSIHKKVFTCLKNMLKIRKKENIFGIGELEWIDLYNENNEIEESVLGYIRRYKQHKILVINNLSNKKISVKTKKKLNKGAFDLLNKRSKATKSNIISLLKHDFKWIKIQ